jgi:hypothetical protein
MSSSFCVQKKVVSFQIEVLQVLFEVFTFKKEEVRLKIQVFFGVFFKLLTLILNKICIQLTTIMLLIIFSVLMLFVVFRFCGRPSPLLIFLLLFCRDDLCKIHGGNDNGGNYDWGDGNDGDANQFVFGESS